ncbi:MAG: RHS repeat-associated core domain-containing protein [Bacteroidota bacterium]|nr:RHS repeat-associated core domain-containing protein [Bacteroidota bacterium]
MNPKILYKAGPHEDFGKINHSYRFLFNGKENDKEVKGEGNSLDFGARIYDSRIGKFLSMDPLAKHYPTESNYSFAGDNPIFLVDVEGKKKITYITIINEDNTVTKIKIVEKDKVRTDYVPSTIFGISTHDNTKVTYDIIENVVIDNRPGAESKSKINTAYKERGIFSFMDDLVETEGGKTKVGSGIVFTSKKGQGEETKVGQTDLTMENIDLLLAVISAAKAASGEPGIPKEVANPKTLTQAFKGIALVIKRINNAAKIGSSMSDEFDKKVVCGNCNDTMDLNKVDSWHPEESLDTIEVKDKK